MKQILTFVLLLCAVVSAQVPSSKHIYLIALENRSYETLVGSASMPYLNGLLPKGAVATQYYANRHDSITDYFLLTSGQVSSTSDSTTKIFDVDNMVRDLLTLGRTYKVYAQSLPYAGFAGISSGAYVKHHTGLPYYTEMGGSSTEMKKLVPLTQLSTDLGNNALPNFALIVPDNAHNMHDCPNGVKACLAVQDAFLKDWVPQILAQPAFQPGGDGLLIIWTDEGDVSTRFDERCSSSDSTGCGGRVLVTMFGPNVKTGYKSSKLYHHENLLKTMLMALGTTSGFPGKSNTASPMSDMFGASSTPPPTGGLTVTSPTNGTTVSSPVHFVAADGDAKAMKVYVDGVSKYATSSTEIDTSLSLSTGTHHVTIKAWENSGASPSQALTITVGSSSSSGVGLTVSSPANGATLSSPVHVVATDGNAKAIKIYVDGVAGAASSSTTLDTSVSLSAGSHRLTIKAWENSGAVVSQVLNLTIN